LRILFCISSLSGGGAETQLYYLSTELSKRGHEVHVFYILSESKIQRDWGLVKMHKCNVNSNYSPRIIFQLLKLLHKYNFDIVQSWVVQMDIIVGFLIRFFNFKWIVRESSSSKNYDYSIKNKLRIFLASKASIIVSNSYQGKLYWESYNIQTELKVIFNGIPYEKIQEAINSKPKFKQPFDEYILYVGRLVEDGTAKKNISKLIIAFNEVLKKRENLKLVIVGEGKDQIKIESVVSRLKIENDVVFLGFQNSENVYKLMKNSLLFVSLSEYEGCPNTVLEALYSCDRMLLSRIEEHLAIFPEPGEYLFVNPNNIDEIANNIFSLINSDPTNDVFSKLVVNYRIDTMVNEYSRIYRQILL
jgi:glycosyltransferase involved in cell wall biosynthesis